MISIAEIDCMTSESGGSYGAVGHVTTRPGVDAVAQRPPVPVAEPQGRKAAGEYNAWHSVPHSDYIGFIELWRAQRQMPVRDA
jgi:hypothetical protein